MNHNDTWSCNCVGPQNGEPMCPCQMKQVSVRDGRYVIKERDLGPVVDSEYNLTKIFDNAKRKK